MVTQSTPNYQLRFNPIALSHFILIHGMALFAFFPFHTNFRLIYLHQKLSYQKDLIDEEEQIRYHYC